MEDQETVQFELAALRAEVAELRDQRETRSTRRNMLRLAGAAAVGGVAAVLGSADDAAALGVTLGATNDAGAFTTSLTSSHGQVTLFVQSSTSPASAIDARSTGDGTGVYGTVLGPTANAFAVWGSLTGSTHGFGVVGSGGAAQLLLNDPMHAAKPSTGAHLAGEVAYSTDSGFYACVLSGTPGTWRTLAHPSSSGTYFPITPTRVFDTRLLDPALPIVAGAHAPVSAANGIDIHTGDTTVPDLVPAGATAIAYNITIVNTVGGGNLAVNSGGNLTATSSIVNWNKDGTVVANSAVVGINSNRQVTVICGGGVGASTHFLIDVLGYYR